MNQNRERLEIAYEILALLRNTPKGAKPTHILFKANLSPVLLKKYLYQLVADGLIRKEALNGRNVYTITENGVRLMELLDSVQEMTRIINLREAVVMNA